MFLILICHFLLTPCIISFLESSSSVESFMTIRPVTYYSKKCENSRNVDITIVIFKCTVTYRYYSLNSVSLAHKLFETQLFAAMQNLAKWLPKC